MRFSYGQRMFSIVSNGVFPRSALSSRVLGEMLSLSIAVSFSVGCHISEKEVGHSRKRPSFTGIRRMHEMYLSLLQKPTFPCVATNNVIS